jgi:hypothetical protein
MQTGKGGDTAKGLVIPSYRCDLFPATSEVVVLVRDRIDDGDSKDL